MDARFLLVATPSGVTLSPEGGAHQSISSPLVGMGQPGLTYYEPAFADEVALLLEEAFRRMQAAAGGSTYLRLTTRPIAQEARNDQRWRDGTLKGGYWLRPPAPGAEAAIVATGAILPEALQAWEELKDDVPGLGLLAVTSADRLHAGWTAARAARWTGARGEAAHVATLLGLLSPTAGLVTVVDGHPATLSWLGSVRGQRVSPLGVERFGQTGDLPDTYAYHRLDTNAICDAMAEIFL
jgi:pyruvate dehydrogenase E1 component